MEQLLFKIQLDLNDSEKQVIDLTDQIENLTKAQKENTRATDEEKKAYEQNRQKLEQLKTERNAHQKAIKANQVASEANQKQIEKEIKSYDANGKSLNQNRQALSEMTKAYGNLKNPSKEATNAIKSLSDKVKEQEAALGDNRRNVGNYADLLKGQFLQGLNQAKGGMLGLNTTMAANPVGTVVLVFTQLLNILKENDDIAESFEQGIAALNAAFDVLKGVVIDAYNALKDFDLQAFFDSFSGIGAKMKEAASQAVTYTRSLQEIEAEEIKLQNELKRRSNLIDELEVKAKNKTLADKERMKLLQEANRLDTENTQKELELQQRKVDAINEEVERRRNANVLSDAFLKEQADAENRLLEIQNESTRTQERNQNRIDALRQEIHDREIARMEEMKKYKEQRMMEDMNFEDIYLAQVETNEQARLRIKKQTDASIAANQKIVNDQLKELGKQNVKDTQSFEQYKANLVINTGVGTVTAATKTASMLSQLGQEGAEKAKGIRVVETILSTYQMAVEAYKSTVGIPFLGPALAPIAATAAVAFGLDQVSRIQSTDVKSKYADGGILSGPSHDNGGMAVIDGSGRKVAELEGGEGIINKRSTAMYRADLSRINQMGGGVKFADGGIFNMATLSSISKQVQQPDLVKIIKSLPAPEVSVKEITRVSDEVNVVKTRASI